MTRYRTTDTTEPVLLNVEKTVETYSESYPGIDPDGVEVSLLLGRASAQQSAALDKLFDALNLGRTRGRFGVLRVLYFAENRTMPQYAIMSHMNVTSASMTGLIDGLVNDGFVIRIRDRADKRVSHVELTAEGERLCEHLIPAMIDFMAGMTVDFTQEEKLQFAGFLRRFYLNAQRRFYKRET